MGGHLGAWGGIPHTCTCTCTHAHAHMHNYTCIEIANGHRHGGIHVYHVYNMFNMHVRVSMHVCACMCAWDTPPHTHTHPQPHPPICHPPSGVDPWNHLKFDNTSTYQDISIPFEDLKFAKNSPPMSWCVVFLGGWVVGWVDWWGQVKSLKI